MGLGFFVFLMRHNLLIVLIDLRIPEAAMKSIMVFLHAFLSLDAHNQLLVVGSSSREAKVIYPQTTNEISNDGRIYTKFHQLDSQIRNAQMDTSTSGFSKISAGLALALTCSLC